MSRGPAIQGTTRALFAAGVFEGVCVAVANAAAALTRFPLHTGHPAGVKSQSPGSGTHPGHPTGVKSQSPESDAIRPLVTPQG